MSGLTNLEILHVVSCPHVPQVSNIITSLRRRVSVHIKVKQSFIRSSTVGGLTPDTKVLRLGPGARSMDITSLMWPWKVCSTVPDSTSQRVVVASPDPAST